MKKWLLTSLFFFVLQLPGYCQQGKTTINYYEPRRDFPAYTGGVNDFEKLYTPTQVKELNSFISSFEKQTTIEIVIVTLDTSFASESDFDDFTIALADKWGVGKKGKDNGVMIAISRTYRKMRLNTGLGMQKFLPDNECKEIINNYFIPEFKKGNYYDGTLNGLNYITKVLRERYK